MGYGACTMHGDLRDGGVQQMMSNLGDTLVESAKFSATSAATEGIVPQARRLALPALPHQSPLEVGHEKMGHVARRRNGPRY